MVVDYPQFGVVESPEYIEMRVKSTARELRELAGQGEALTFDPFAFANKIGIKVEVVAMPPGCSGRLRTDKGYALIELNSSQVPTRQRFTMCHELAHICFWDSGPIVRERGPTSFRNNKLTLEETLCDRIASELLMPTDTFVSLAKRERPSFNGIRCLAQQFNVSNPAVVNKLVDTQGHGWVTASIRWIRTSTGSLGREGALRVDSGRSARGKQREARARVVANEAFRRAERLLLTQREILRSLTERWMTLPMHEPAVTIWRNHIETNLIHGRIFFSVVNHPKPNGS